MIPLCYTTPTSNFGHDIFIIFNALRNPQPGFHFWISFAFFSKEFTQIFDEVTRSPQLSVIPGTNTATLSPDKWYGTSEFNYIFSSYNLYTLFFYTQNVKIYSDSFHIRFVQRGDLWKQTTHQLQMGGTEFHRVFLSDVFGDYIPSFHYPGRSAKQIFQTGSDWKEWWTLFNLSY